MVNSTFILAVLAIIFVVLSYYPGAPTLGVAVIVLAVALMLLGKG